MDIQELRKKEDLIDIFYNLVSIPSPTKNFYSEATAKFLEPGISS